MTKHSLFYNRDRRIAFLAATRASKESARYNSFAVAHRIHPQSFLVDTSSRRRCLLVGEWLIPFSTNS